MSTQIGSTWADTVQAITTQGLASGLTPDQINAAIAVSRSEGGLLTSAGDYVAGSPTSFGPFQFHLGGQLNGFAAWLNTTLGSAISTAQSSLSYVTAYALGSPGPGLPNGGYLYQALKAGTAKGLSGSALAYYASANGQVSQDPGAAASWFVTLFGGSGSASPPAPSPDVAPAPAPVDKVSTASPGAELANLNALWQSIPTPNINSVNPFQGIADFFTNVTNWVTLAFWVLVGILIAIVGLWLLVRS